MKHHKNEQEQRKLNRKLLKLSFLSELKEKKAHLLKIVIDILTIFIASFAAHTATDAFSNFFSVSSWFIEIVIFLIVMAIITFVGILLDKSIKKIFKNINN